MKQETMSEINTVMDIYSAHLKMQQISFTLLQCWTFTRAYQREYSLWVFDLLSVWSLLFDSFIKNDFDFHFMHRCFAFSFFFDVRRGRGIAKCCYIETCTKIYVKLHSDLSTVFTELEPKFNLPSNSHKRSSFYLWRSSLSIE